MPSILNIYYYGVLRSSSKTYCFFLSQYISSLKHWIFIIVGSISHNLWGFIGGELKNFKGGIIRSYIKTKNMHFCWDTVYNIKVLKKRSSHNLYFQELHWILKKNANWALIFSPFFTLFHALNGKENSLEYLSHGKGLKGYITTSFQGTVIEIVITGIKQKAPNN